MTNVLCGLLLEASLIKRYTFYAEKKRVEEFIINNIIVCWEYIKIWTKYKNRKKITNYAS